MTEPDIVMFKPSMAPKAAEAAAETLRGRWIGEGPKVREFEAALRDKFAMRFVVATSSGTAALHLALVLAGVGQGDEVISTALTCTATNHAIKMVGAKPVFADIQYLTGNIDPNDIERHITERTKAIMVVHWGGYPCDMNQIGQLARKYDLPVIQDSAHALGATLEGVELSHWSEFSCYSFQAIKALTTVEGGALAVRTLSDQRRATQLRWYGIDRELRTETLEGYWSWPIREVGYKYNLNDVAAAIGLANLEHFDVWQAFRRTQANYYRDHFKDLLGLTLFEREDDRDPSDWLFMLHVQRRDDFCRMMTKRGIEASIVHERNDVNPVFGGRRNDLPSLDEFEKSYIAIPIGPHLRDDDVTRIINAVSAGW